MNSKMGIVTLVVGLMVFSGLAMASPPVPPPPEGFNIPTNVDVEMSAGDRTKIEQFGWTWVYDMEDIDPSTLSHPGVRDLWGHDYGYIAPPPTGIANSKDYGYTAVPMELRNTGIRRTFGDFLDGPEQDDIGRIREEIFAPLIPPDSDGRRYPDFFVDPGRARVPQDTYQLPKPWYIIDD
jgi:hypothetical protein